MSARNAFAFIIVGATFCAFAQAPPPAQRAPTTAEPTKPATSSAAIAPGTEKTTSLSASDKKFVHDAAEGGLAIALAEAALWSGCGAELELDEDPLTLHGEIGGQVIIAVPPGQVEPDPTGGEVEVRRIGTAGGDSLLGIPLGELRRAYEGDA